jgi:reductive dehalogenase
VASLAEFIRGLGYNAIPSSNETALNVPLAIDAGIGEDLRIGGCLMSPEYGPRLRLAKVITDLPLATDKPITFGVHEFCDQCQKCAKWCPMGAIPHGPRSYGAEKNDVDAPGVSESVGPLRWINNQQRCRASFAVGGTNCGVCLRVCPWNKPRGAFYSFAKWLAINGGSLSRRMLIRLDDVLGYGKQMSPSEWWGEAP